VPPAVGSVAIDDSQSARAATKTGIPLKRRPGCLASARRTDTGYKQVGGPADHESSA